MNKDSWYAFKRGDHEPSRTTRVILVEKKELQLMKNFYRWPKLVQWLAALLLFVIGFGVCLPVLGHDYALLFIPLIAPILNFATVPILRLIGIYHYLTPLVLSTVHNNRSHDLEHDGNSLLERTTANNVLPFGSSQGPIKAILKAHSRSSVIEEQRRAGLYLSRAARRAVW